MTINRQPTIYMCKADETAFINVKTFWVVSLPLGDTTIDLRIKHRYPEDEILALSFDMGDATELMTREEWRECVDKIVEHEHLHFADAEQALMNGDFNATRARVMTQHEADVIAHLRRTWSAFTLLFNPAINL